MPLQFKIAKVIPIHKAGDKDLMDNYRPISLLSTFSKIIEKIAATRITFFIEENNILSKWQFGFSGWSLHVSPYGSLLEQNYGCLK